MRFLETRIAKEKEILRLVEKRPNEVPKYAILSHTWEADEITFDDIESGKANDGSTKTPAARASLYKLLGACVQAAVDEYDYIWIDSCCIDKRSSAELSEAINSMFAWYRDADICYAFLLDAPNELGTPEAKAKFARNRWFTRGFTLQELLAPQDVIFFSGDWIRIGQKKFLCTLLADITGIDIKILLGDTPISSESVARRMSWAAKRVTTRPEDIAYCLMGIFSVNMPMLYGEGGEKAGVYNICASLPLNYADLSFIRLQEEIMKQSDDQSLFAWVDLTKPEDAISGLLAPAPSCFLHSNSIEPYHDWEPRKPYTLTNRGLKIRLHLSPRGESGLYVAAIDCPVPPDNKDVTFLAIYLQKLSDSDEQYARVRVGQWASVHQRGRQQTLYIRQNPQAPSPEGAFLHHYVQLRTGPSAEVYKLVCLLAPSKDNNASALTTRVSARDWVPVKWPVVFPVRRRAAQLSLALIFQRDEDGERVAVMVGTLRGFDIAFSASDIEYDLDLNEISFRDLERVFEPSVAGRFQMRYHSIQMSATPVLHSSSKYYMIDVGIEAFSLSLRDIAREVYGAAAGVRDREPSVNWDEEEEGDADTRKVSKKQSFWKRIIP
ncbi:HET-domain-containing protein [Hypomontagnella monticulosa]|nr:HET-domain-containing protein [Hypomontagnella monticulosa]